MKTSELLEEALKLLWDGKEHPIPQGKYVTICAAIECALGGVGFYPPSREYEVALNNVREALGGHFYMEGLLAAEGLIPSRMTNPLKTPPDLAPLVQEARRALMVELLTALDRVGD